MIKKIKLFNYQSHGYTELELSGNINVIYGPSDSGKSSVIRAIKTVLFRDNFYIRYNESTAFVEIEFDNTILKRIYETKKISKCPNCKEKIENEKICKCGEILSNKVANDFFVSDTKEFRNFGTNFPLEILCKTRIFPFKILDLEENFNLFNQFDDLFFVGKSYAGSVRTKFISSLIPDSEKVDTLIKNFNSEILQKNAELQYLENQVELSEGKFAKCKDDFEKCEKLNTEIIELQSSKEEFSQDHIVLQRTKKEIEKSNIVLRIEDKTKKFAEVLSGVKNAFKQLEELSSTLKGLKKLRSEIEKYSLQDIEFQKFAIVELEEYKLLLRNLYELKKLKGYLLDFGMDVFLTEKKKKEKEKLLQDKIASYTKEIQENAICPITKQEFCDTCKKIISGELCKC